MCVARCNLATHKIILEVEGMKEITSYLAAFFFVLIIYSIVDYFSKGAIRSGVFKYISVGIAIICAILLSQMI